MWTSVPQHQGQRKWGHEDPPKASALQLEDLTSKQMPPISPWHRDRQAVLVWGFGPTGPPLLLPVRDPTPSEALSHYPTLEPLALLHCPIPSLTGTLCWGHSLDAGHLYPFQGNWREKVYCFSPYYFLFIKMSSWAWTLAGLDSVMTSGLGLYPKLRPLSAKRPHLMAQG